MNDLTRNIVTEMAKEHKSAAIQNGDLFYRYVYSEWWNNYIVADYGVYKKQRFLHLFRLWRPDLFDGEFIKDYIGQVFDLDVQISHRIKGMLERKIEREPELQLTHWGELPQQIAQPQMELF